MQLRPFGVDRDITNWVVEHRVEWLRGPAHVVSEVGGTLALAIVATAVGVWLWARGHRSDARMLVLGSASGWLVMIGLKHLFDRQRPPEQVRLENITTYAFPSGHAMVSMVILGLIGVVAYRHVPKVREHSSVLLLAPLLSIVIGCSRMYLGVHWMSDVLAGWLFGAVWAGIVLLVQSALSRAVAAPASSALDHEDDGAEHPDRQSDEAAHQSGR